MEHLLLLIGFIVFLLLRQCSSISPSYEVRFHGSKSNKTKHGILQIRKSSSDGSSPWQYLEPDSIGLTGARLVCRQLGFPYVCGKGSEIMMNITTEDIFWFDTSCTGDEVSLQDCTMSLRQQSLLQRVPKTMYVLTVTCASEDDIEVRLSNSSSIGKGTVEYRCMGDWMNICFDAWYPATANTLCKQLGYGGVVEDVQVAMPTASLSSRSFYCSTTTQMDHIFDCLMAEESCVSGKAASVTCGIEITVEKRGVTLCDSTMTCRGNCGNATMTGCRCDSACHLYNDCCYDFTEECGLQGEQMLHHTQGNILDLSLYSCEKPLGGMSNIYQQAEWFYFIRKCPSMTEEMLRDRCEGPSSVDDVLRNLPVYDHEGDVFYNVFCAACNGRNLNDLTAWRVEAEPEENFFTNEKQIYYVVLPPWEERGKTRPCYAEGMVTDYCPSFTGSQLESACQNYQAPVVHSGGAVYRNPHCAKCHSKRINEIPIESCTGCQCQNPYCFLKCPDGRTGRLASVTLLFDFFTSDEVQCTGIGEIYDMFLERCRVLVCPPGTIFVADSCVSMESGSDDPTLQSTMSCLISAIASSLTEIAEIILDRNVTSNENSAFLFAENINDAQSVALTLGAIVDYSNEVHQMICNLSDVMLIAPPPFNDTVPDVCSQHTVAPAITNTAFRADNGDLWHLNRTFLMFNEYHFFGNSSVYVSSQPSGKCWFALLNTLICELQVVPEDKFAIDGNLAVHIPTGTELTFDEYFLLLNGSYVVCSGNLNGSTDVQSIMYLIGASMSILCLLATLVTYTVLPKLRNVAGKCLMNVALALLGANLIFVLNPLLSYNTILCSIMAALAHFFWLGCFSWMNVAGFNMARTFGWNASGTSIQSTRSCSKGTLVSYILYGWGVPFVIVAIGICFHLCQCTGLRFQYGGPLICWIEGERRAMMYAVGIPIYSSILLNVLLLCFTAVSLIRHRREGRSLRANQTFIFKENLTIVAKLSVVLGTSWTFGVVYSFTEDVVVMYIFVTLTSLQGVLLFVFFGITKRVRRMWKAKFRPSVADVTVYTVKCVSTQWRDSTAGLTTRTSPL
ncbi:uncharacterized protein LOC129267512 [Lytechinus pictus]|uniref:uncharacterized protein LOC129267512 n=1 Tax=Lytechinus pictus TaxID=7653 RepID=UPI0030BA000A